MRKRIFASIIVMIMGVSLLVGCSGSAESNSDGGSDSNVAVEETVTEETKVEEAEVENTEEETADEEIRGNQSVTFTPMSDGDGRLFEITYDADTFYVEEEETGAHFYTIENDAYIFAEECFETNAYDLIESFKGYGWENYAASEVEEYVINGIPVQHFVQSYVKNDKEREECYYIVSFPNDMAMELISYDGVLDITLLEKLLIKVTADGIALVETEVSASDSVAMYEEAFDVIPMTAEENGGKIEVVYDAGAFDVVADEYGASFNVKAVTSADFPVLNEETGSKGFITYMGDYSAERYAAEYGLNYYENKIEDIGWTAYVCYKTSVSGEIEESYWLVEMENGNLLVVGLFEANDFTNIEKLARIFITDFFVA